ncbi:metallophosphoesterase family protein [Pararhizobium haloflavum]|uniref:metallophosphoesterase family protein n=1 Tax=Pararhizobium haloflavum TaxID=2037914 RepID=UPI001FE07801|nr:metallophosphoesterase family protein [Pararhizobium haloflavum]
MTIELSEARAPPGMRIYAIGDVHGYADLLRAMHERIAADLAARPVADWRIVHVGDYVDRGPDAKGVIDFLLRRLAEDDRIIALRGNHDQGMIDFLQEPQPISVFAHNGGETTARSYGVELELAPGPAFERTARLFRAAVPAIHARFLAERPFSASFGDYFFCHAGIEPGVALSKQSPRALMWIRDAFLDWTGPHPKIVVHGHTPQPAVDFRANRINIDTGVYIRESLAGLVLEDDRRDVITVSR